MSAGAPSVPSVARARRCLVLAALLWSLGSVFMRVLREPLGLGLDQPSLTPLQIAFYRGLFGGLCGMYLSALDGPAANAIFLQNTAPVWVYLFAVLALGERGDRRGWVAVFLAAGGAAVIVVGNWPRDSGKGDRATRSLQLLLGLGSGVVYAVVVL